MKYHKDMKRFAKAGDGYKEDNGGAFYKGTDGKMYAMEGVDKPGDKPGQHDDHAYDSGKDVEGGSTAAKKGNGTAKSAVTEDDFQKSLDQLEAIAKTDDPASRKEELLAKAQTGEELSEGEREELFKALGGGDAGDEVVDDDPAIVKAVDAAMDPENNGEQFQKALDVSEYLEQQHTALTASLGELAKAMDSSDQRQHSFNLVFAKAFHQVGELVKGMSERLGVIERQPVRPPKTKGIPAGDPQVVQKSFADGEAPSDQLSKIEILDGLESLMRKSIDGGKEGMSAGGEDILHATAKYEQMNQISKALLVEVTEFQKSQAH